MRLGDHTAAKPCHLPRRRCAAAGGGTAPRPLQLGPGLPRLISPLRPGTAGVPLPCLGPGRRWRAARRAGEAYKGLASALQGLVRAGGRGRSQGRQWPPQRLLPTRPGMSLAACLPLQAAEHKGEWAQRPLVDSWPGEVVAWTILPALSLLAAGWHPGGSLVTCHQEWLRRRAVLCC